MFSLHFNICTLNRTVIFLKLGSIELIPKNMNSFMKYNEINRNLEKIIILDHKSGVMSSWFSPSPCYQALGLDNFISKISLKKAI